MERERGFKVIAIVALVVAVAGVSIGFAAFTATLNINDATADVNPNANFDVKFSNVNNALTAGDLLATNITGNATTGATATISADGLTVSGISADFAAPGDNVTFTFYVLNASIYTAYLKSIIFENAAAVCTSTGIGDATVTTSIMNAACPNMGMQINVGTSTASYATAATIGTDNALDPYTGVNYDNHVVTLTLSYDGNVAVDGPVHVEFGDITLGYSSAA